MRALLESNPDALLLLDSAGCVVHATAASDRHLGWAPDDLIGMRALDLVHPDDRAVLARKLAEGSGGHGSPVSEELRVRGVDGTYRTIEAVGVSRLDESAIHGIVVTARDVSDRRFAEEQLRQAQKMDAVSRLAGGIAHDFNNLLTAILGYCNLLLEDLPARAAMRPDLEEIRKAGDRAAALTRQLLAFSRRQMLRPQPIALSALVQELEIRVRELLGDRIDLQLDVAADVPMVNVDPVSVEDILFNLALNARDAMTSGGQVTVETRYTELDRGDVGVHPGVVAGGYVMLAVSDNGDGMDAVTRGRIFEPFFTTKSHGKGSGLGLATVYGLVQQIGGYISVTSQPGHGTVFKVYFPALGPPRGAIGPDPEARGETVPAAPETVLVVAAVDAARTVTTGVLRQQGYTVLEARTAAEALRLVKRHEGTIHLLVAEVVMAETTGRELADRIQQTRPSLKVLFLSGSAEQGVMYRELSEGVPFLQEPFTAAELTQKVRLVLDRTMTQL